MTGRPQASDWHHRRPGGRITTLSPGKISCPRGDLNSCHPQDTSGHLRPYDLAFSLPYRAAGAPSERPDTPRYTGASITGNITRPQSVLRAPRPPALARSPLGELGLRVGQAGLVGLVAVPLDLPPHVGEEILGPVAAEPGADAAVGGPHRARHADVESRRRLLSCIHTEDRTARLVYPQGFGYCVGTRFWRGAAVREHHGAAR